MSNNFSKAQQTAQIIHLEGMKKAFEQVVEQLQLHLARVDERLAEIREQRADE